MLLLTPLSALVECISYRGGGVEGSEEGGGTDDRQYKLIKRPQPRFGLSLKAHVHAHTCARTHTLTHTLTHIYKNTQTAFLIDRWLSQQIESWDQHPRGPFLPYTHLCSAITCVCVCVCVCV